MTHRQSSSQRWWRLLLAAIAAVVVGVLGAAAASATTVPELGNRVGASTPAVVNIVGPHESISAGQRWGHAPPGAGTVVATGVAAKGAAEVPDALVLARGGTNAAERFASGSGVARNADGTLSGVSVNSGRTVEEAAQGIPHKQIGVTTAGDVRRAGGSVTLDPLAGNPGHCLLSGCTADVFSQLFTPTIKNPGL